MKRKSGFSLVEVAVAIAVVAIASTITLMVVLKSNTLLLRARSQVYAAYEAENVLKAYNASSLINPKDANLDSFKNIVKSIHGESDDLSEKEYCVIDDATLTIYYTGDFSLSDKDSYVYRLVLSTDSNAPGIVVYSNADKVFYRYGV